MLFLGAWPASIISFMARRQRKRHAVVHLAAVKDDLAVIAQLFGGIGKIIGVHADAVTAHKARLKAQRVPLCVHAVQDLNGIDAHFAADHGNLVHKGDIDVPLAVFYDLYRLGGLNVGHGEGAGLDDDVVNLLDDRAGFLVHAGDNFANIGEGMYFIAGIDAFGRIANSEIHPAFEPGILLQDGNAYILSDAGVDRGFIDYNAAL